MDSDISGSRFQPSSSSDTDSSDVVPTAAQTATRLLKMKIYEEEEEDTDEAEGHLHESVSEKRLHEQTKRRTATHEAARPALAIPPPRRFVKSDSSYYVDQNQYSKPPDDSSSSESQISPTFTDQFAQSAIPQSFNLPRTDKPWSVLGNRIGTHHKADAYHSQSPESEVEDSEEFLYEYEDAGIPQDFSDHRPPAKSDVSGIPQTISTIWDGGDEYASDTNNSGNGADDEASEKDGEVVGLLKQGIKINNLKGDDAELDILFQKPLTRLKEFVEGISISSADGYEALRTLRQLREEPGIIDYIFTDTASEDDASMSLNRRFTIDAIEEMNTAINKIDSAVDGVSERVHSLLLYQGYILSTLNEIASFIDN